MQVVFLKILKLSSRQFFELTQKFPGIVGYHLPNGNVKLAAGWMIEHSGPNEGQSWKGL